MVSQKNDDQDDSSDVKIISENKTNTKKENGESSKNAMDIDIDLDDDDDSNFVSKNKRERSNKSFRSNDKQSPIKEELSSDSEDALVIDIEDESPKKKENNVKNTKPQSPAKRKRSTSSNKTNDEIKSPPAKKTSRRGSVTSMKKFDQVENELEAMFAGLEDEDTSSNIVAPVKNEKKSTSNENNSPHKSNILQNKKSSSSTSSPSVRKKSTDSGIVCSICGNTFARNDGLRRHLETIHKKSRDDTNDLRKTKFVQPKKEIKEEPVSTSANEALKKFGKKLMKEEPDEEWMDSNKSKVKNEVKKPPPKKKKSKKDLETTKKSSKQKKEEPEDMDMTYQERLLEKFKGPFVHIQGDIENTRWTNVINFANDSLDPRNDKADLDSITRITNFGIPSTSLSSKYDVRNVDESWICMFCRKSSHYGGLGDLFGPYFVTSEQGKSLNLPSPAKPNNSKDLVSSFILGGSDQAGAKAKKRQKKKSGSLESPLKGSKQTGSDQRCEVWFHEDCICWLPQIRLIGNQILGLPEAIKVTQKAVCIKCGYRGCTIACSQKKCHNTAHFPCAQELHWEIDEENFLARCANCVNLQ